MGRIARQRRCGRARGDASGRGRLGRFSRSDCTAAPWNLEAALPARERRRARSADPGGGLGLAGQQALALRALARQLARPADGFRPLARLLLGGFFVMAAELHLAENALALHFLLQRLEGLVDIVVANENLHVVPLGWRFKSGKHHPRVADTPLPSVRLYQFCALLSTKARRRTAILARLSLRRIG